MLSSSIIKWRQCLSCQLRDLATEVCPSMLRWTRPILNRRQNSKQMCSPKSTKNWSKVFWESIMPSHSHKPWSQRSTLKVALTPSIKATRRSSCSRTQLRFTRLSTHSPSLSKASSTLRSIVCQFRQRRLASLWSQSKWDCSPWLLGTSVMCHRRPITFTIWWSSTISNRRSRHVNRLPHETSSTYQIQLSASKSTVKKTTLRKLIDSVASDGISLTKRRTRQQIKSSRSSHPNFSRKKQPSVTVTPK